MLTLSEAFQRVLSWCTKRTATQPILCSQCYSMVYAALTSLKSCFLLSQLLVQCRFNVPQKHKLKHFTCHVDQHVYDARSAFTVAQIAFLLINTPLFHSSSTFSSFHIQLQKPTRTSSDTSPLALITSGVYCHNMVPFHSHTVSFFVAFLISELVYGAMSTHYLCSASVVCTNLSIHVFHFILNILSLHGKFPNTAFSSS